jgi:hypothetical protein
MKRVPILLIILTLIFLTIPTAQAATENSVSLGDIQIFPKDNVWNIPIDTLPVDPKSSDYINILNKSAYLRPNLGFPYNVVNNSVVKSNVTFRYSWVSDNVQYPIPQNMLIEGGTSPETCIGDCHVLIIDKDSQILYELFDLEGQLPNGTWVAGSGAIFNLSSNALRQAGQVSADAAGLPMLAGVIRYDEIEAGEINHAIRFTTPLTQNKYTWPARSWTSNNVNTSYPMFGQRYRLKSTFDTSKYPPESRIILEALKKYGMILADNGPPLWISGTRDDRWSAEIYKSLATVHGSDFELVNTTSLIVDKDSGQTRIIPSKAPTNETIPSLLPTPIPIFLFPETNEQLNIFNLGDRFRIDASQTVNHNSTENRSTG